MSFDPRPSIRNSKHECWDTILCKGELLFQGNKDYNSVWQCEICKKMYYGILLKYLVIEGVKL